MKEEIYNKHKHCEVVIRYKHTAYQQMCGMYCKKHNKFIDWIKRDIANELVNDTSIQVEPWLDLKSNKSKRNNTKSYLQKRKQKQDISKRIKQTSYE
jgi:hypothetical protein